MKAPALAIAAAAAVVATVLDFTPARRAVSAQEPTRVVSSRREATMRPEILGTHGIVAAGRHYSVEAGIRILREGGNAIDAGVATVFAASVCEISHFGFGGEAPTMIYAAKTPEIVVINGQGTAPKGATPAPFR